MPAILIGGILPDFDFIFIFFAWFNQVHRVITHNLFFLLLAAVFASLFALKGRKRIVGFSLFLGGLLHLLIDSFMDNNPSNGIGVALLWPLNNELFSPFNLFHASLNAPGWDKPFKMIMSLIPGMIYELPLYAVALFLLFRQKTGRNLQQEETKDKKHSLTTK